MSTGGNEGTDDAAAGVFLGASGCHGFSCCTGTGEEESESVASQLSQTGRWLSCGRREGSAGVLVRVAGAGGCVMPIPRMAFILRLGRRRRLCRLGGAHSGFGEVGDWVGVLVGRKMRSRRRTKRRSRSRSRRRRRRGRMKRGSRRMRRRNPPWACWAYWAYAWAPCAA